MYSIFFHITGLSLIEIFFYFYYIGPMETIIFKNAISDAFKNSLQKELNDDVNEPIYIIMPFNSSQLILIENEEESKYSTEFEDMVNEAEQQRQQNNNELFHVALFSWSIIFTITMVFFTTEMLIKYYFHKRKNTLHNVSSTNSIEMINMSLDSGALSCTNDDSIQESPPEKKFIQWDVINKNIKHTIIHYSILVILIILFEYWFFNNIILKYDIVSMEELEYMLYKKLTPIIYSYVNRHIEYSDK